MRPVPPIVTTVPIGPLVGAMLLIVGITLNCWLMLWPRLGRVLRTAPVSRQTNPNRVWHSPRFHSRPATLLRPPFCPFHRSALFLPAAAQVKKETSRKRQKGKKHEIRRSQHTNERGRGFPRCSIGVRSQ